MLTILCRILVRRQGQAGVPDSFCDYFCTRFFTVILIQLLCFSLWYFPLAQRAVIDTDLKLAFLLHPSNQFSFSWTFLMSYSQAKYSNCDHKASDLRPTWVTCVLLSYAAVRRSNLKTLEIVSVFSSSHNVLLILCKPKLNIIFFFISGECRSRSRLLSCNDRFPVQQVWRWKQRAVLSFKSKINMCNINNRCGVSL